MKILCIGQSAWDITFPVSEYPQENKKMKTVLDKIECGGGSSNNAAYLLAKWGMDVTLISAVGNDTYAKNIIDEMESVNVDTRYFTKLEGVTNTSVIVCNLKNSTRTILSSKSDKIKIDQNTEINFYPDAIYLDGNEYEYSVKMLKEYPRALKMLDAGSVKEGSKELCKLVDYVVCSHDFARDYTGIDFEYDELDKLEKIHERLSSEFKNTVIITLESTGCFTKIDEEYKIIPSIIVKAQDTTGAGDIYHGALTYFLLKEMKLEKSIRLANITGALSTEKIGGKNSMPEISEVLSYEY